MSLAVFIGTACKVIFILTPKMFYEIDTKAQCYKTFYVRNLRIYVISESVCPWQSFLAKYNV
jgi:hypothetical protein